MSGHLLFLVILLSTFMAAFCADLDSDEVVPIETEGGNSIGPSVAVIHDGRPKRHRPFLAGLLVGAALRRPYYGGYYGGYGGYGGYHGYHGYGGYGGYGHGYYG
ncbi:hypothetical protein GHT06_012271 [Daphnia sinensis]|uniref:Uncharacterized protein n=1 Tax=Daphnia sinensis TaxID=1820382 RepID=A0AAD5PZP6_9CRUS|nr:hypothetical protein GHT06_012271 [Daphnia sinensis]